MDNDQSQGAVAAEGERPAPTSPAAAQRPRRLWSELPVLIVVALIVALVIKTFVVQAFFIPSSSMEDTLLVGDKILVSKLVFHFRGIHRGDIVVFDGTGSWNSGQRPARAASNPLTRAYDATLSPLFHSVGSLFGTPVGQTDYVKRVIGLPGDHVACCNAQGLVTVNGVALHERSYLFPGAAPSQLRFSVTVPSGRLWVMGDYRTVSDDSRLRQSKPGHGTIPENEVIGRAFVIVWPPSRWRILPIPATYGQPGLSKLAAAAGVPASRSGAAAPYVPLAGGFAVALPVTWLERRARLRRRRCRLSVSSASRWGWEFSARPVQLRCRRPSRTDAGPLFHSRVARSACRRRRLPIRRR